MEIAAAASRSLSLSGVFKGGAELRAGRRNPKHDHLPNLSILQGQKAFGFTLGRISPVSRKKELTVTARMTRGPTMQSKNEKEDKEDGESKVQEYSELLLKMGALDDPVKWWMLGMGLAALSWPQPAFAADVDNQVLKELIDSIRWGIGFMIAAPVVMFVVQLLTGTNTAGLIAERKEREFQIRILSVLNTLSLAETGQVELATVMSRALAKDVVQDRLKALAVELMTDQAFSAVAQKQLAEWLKSDFDTISSKFNDLQPKFNEIDQKFVKQDGQFNEMKTELGEVKSELGRLSTQVSEAVELLKTMSDKQ